MSRSIYFLLFFISHSNHNFAFTIATVCKYHSNPKLAFVASSCNLMVICKILPDECVHSLTTRNSVVAIKQWIEILLPLIIIFDMYIFNLFYLPHSYNPRFLICLCFNMVSFRGQKSLGHTQIGLPYGFNSKFPTSIPTTFICRVPPPPRVIWGGYQQLGTSNWLLTGGWPLKRGSP